MKILIAVLISAVVGLGIALVVYLPELDSGVKHDDQVSDRTAVADDITASRSNAIVRAAEEVGPAVVSVSVTQTRVVNESPGLPFGDEFFDQFFRDFFGQRRYVERVASQGSGVIVSPDGLVVTNEHVVRGATGIKVTLPDAREFDGKLLASDEEYDVAVIKIDGNGLPAARLGDSDQIMIGEWAIAIGNPFGYLLADTRPTVTVGVISALHREVKMGGDVLGVYKEMIQTDAAINPGNSGGALVNSLGDVIGINAFIISKSGGSMGIGFAIPINRVKSILDELAKYGRIRNIWIGLLVQEVTPLIARSLNLDRAEGVIISQVDPGSPADKGGLRRADVIIEVDGKAVPDFESARRAIFGAQIGDRLEFTIIREGKRKSVAVAVEEAPAR